ncbi:hypothetical protein AB7942_15105 [Neobacillus sp. BF23-41]|uniref:hypothetical protein n=1 Tax=Neobacillus sp. BF23-41 TaxID=3240280 RepID=UPI0034E609EC
MDGDHHHQKQKPTREKDLISRFIFGNRKSRETHKENENHAQESPETNEQLSTDTRSNRHDDWFFGRRKKEPTTAHKNRQHQTQTTQSKIENFMNNVDIDLLMQTYDTLLETTKQYKPLLKEITPFFSKIGKKFKK